MMINLPETIKFVITDFDGIVTDNCVYIDSRGEMTRKLNFKDVMAFSILRKKGYHIGIVSGEKNSAIEILAKKFNIEVVIMCDTSHIFNKEGAKTMVFSKGADSVDFALINYLEKEDIVITQDYGLAAMAMNKASYVINQNGMIYNDENIDRLLYSRHISKKIRKSGGKTKGPKKRTKEDDINFEKTLNEILELIYFLWKL